MQFGLLDCLTRACINEILFNRPQLYSVSLDGHVSATGAVDIGVEDQGTIDLDGGSAADSFTVCRANHKLCPDHIFVSAAGPGIILSIGRSYPGQSCSAKENRSDEPHQ